MGLAISPRLRGASQTHPLERPVQGSRLRTSSHHIQAWSIPSVANCVSLGWQIVEQGQTLKAPAQKWARGPEVQKSRGPKAQTPRLRVVPSPRPCPQGCAVGDVGDGALALALALAPRGRQVPLAWVDGKGVATDAAGLGLGAPLASPFGRR